MNGHTVALVYSYLNQIPITPFPMHETCCLSSVRGGRERNYLSRFIMFPSHLDFPLRYCLNCAKNSPQRASNTAISPYLRSFHICFIILRVDAHINVHAQTRERCAQSVSNQILRRKIMNVEPKFPPRSLQIDRRLFAGLSSSGSSPPSSTSSSCITSPPASSSSCIL